MSTNKWSRKFRQTNIILPQYKEEQCKLAPHICIPYSTKTMLRNFKQKDKIILKNY